MNQHVVAAILANYKIHISVVYLHFVNVVHFCAIRKKLPQGRFCNDDVFWNVSSFCRSRMTGIVDEDVASSC